MALFNCADRPIKFHIIGVDEDQRATLQTMIEERGGLLSTDANDIVKFVPRETWDGTVLPREQLFDAKFITDCIEANKILSPEGYRLDAPGPNDDFVVKHYLFNTCARQKESTSTVSVSCQTIEEEVTIREDTPSPLLSDPTSMLRIEVAGSPEPRAPEMEVIDVSRGSDGETEDSPTMNGHKRKLSPDLKRERIKRAVGRPSPETGSSKVNASGAQVDGWMVSNRFFSRGGKSMVDDARGSRSRGCDDNDEESRPEVTARSSRSAAARECSVVDDRDHRRPAASHVVDDCDVLSISSSDENSGNPKKRRNNDPDFPAIPGTSSSNKTPKSNVGDSSPGKKKKIENRNNVGNRKVNNLEFVNCDQSSDGESTDDERENRLKAAKNKINGKRRESLLSQPNTSSHSDEGNVEVTNKRNPSPRKSVQHSSRKAFDSEERRIMLEYLIRTRTIKKSKGLTPWKNMIDSGLLVHRTDKSLHNHFIKYMLPNIEKAPLEPNIMEKFLRIRHTKE